MTQSGVPSLVRSKSLLTTHTKTYEWGTNQPQSCKYWGQRHVTLINWSYIHTNMIKDQQIIQVYCAILQWGIYVFLMNITNWASFILSVLRDASRSTSYLGSSRHTQDRRTASSYLPLHAAYCECGTLRIPKSNTHNGHICRACRWPAMWRCSRWSCLTLSWTPAGRWSRCGPSGRWPHWGSSRPPAEVPGYSCSTYWPGPRCPPNWPWSQGPEWGRVGGPRPPAKETCLQR